jgi:hypothetical protein
VGWTSIYQLFWGSLGTRVLTHPHMLFFQIDPKKKSEFAPIGHPLGWSSPTFPFFKQLGWIVQKKPRIFGFILKTKPRTFEIRTQLGLRLETFWSQFLSTKILSKYIFIIIYSHLLSFILIYYHLLFASVLCDNIPLGSFVVLFGILDCQSGFSFVPLDAA